MTDHTHERGSDLIDLHAHYFATEYLDTLRSFGVDTSIGGDPLGGPEGLSERRRMMAEAGIALQVVSGAPLFPSLPDGGDSAWSAQVLNNSLLALCAAHPDSFRAAVALPLPHVPAALAEIERVAGHPDVVAVAIPTTVLGAPITGAEHFPVFERLDELEATVLVHPVGTATGFYASEFDLSWLVGAVFEDTVVATDMIISGWLDRFPRLRVVIPHLGGALPFILKRLDDQYQRRRPDAVRPSTQVSRLWFDTVNSDPGSLEQTVAAVGAERLVLGTDFPYLPGQMFRDATTYVRRCELSPGSVDAVEFRNARALLSTESTRDPTAG